MRLFLLSLFFSGLFFTLTAQNDNRAILPIYYSSTDLEGYRASANIPLRNQSAPFYSYFLEWDQGKIPANIRFADADNNWTDWIILERETHNTEKHISQLYFVDTQYVHFQLQFSESKKTPGAVNLHFYNPGKSSLIRETSDQAENFNRGPLQCPCGQPDFLNRAGWCPDGDCPEHPEPVNTQVSHLVIHHSATSNNSTDWAAVVRSFWDTHVNGNGWSDIGYNWLIDPNGTIYQGREDNVIGAHYCSNNSNTMGVCIIGNFTNVAPTTEALESLEKLLAWKSCDRDIDPLGESFHPSSGATINNIIGHRDGCSTACPGNTFYPILPDVRQGVVDYIATSCTGLATPIHLEASFIVDFDYELSWIHDTDEEEGFLLEQSLNGNNYALLANLPANTLSYETSGLVADQIYTYRIRAYNQTDTSTYSNIVEISTFPVSTKEVLFPPSAVIISPNPVGNNLHLLIDLEEELETLLITDATQRVLHQQVWQTNPGLSDYTLDVSHFPAGTYFLSLANSSKKGTWQFIKH